MEFATYPKLSLRNPMPTPSSSEQLPGNPSVTLPWEGNSETTPSLLFLQAGCSSVGGTCYSGSRNSSSGESFAGVTDSSCALSLLSNQAWAPRNRAPSLGMNNFMSFDDTPITQLAAASSHSHHGHGPSIHHQLSNAPWCFKGIDAAANCSHEIVPDLGLGHQISQPITSPLPGELDVSQGRRHYMDLEQSRVYDDSQHHMHWSLQSPFFPCGFV